MTNNQHLQSLISRPSIQPASAIITPTTTPDYLPTPLTHDNLQNHNQLCNRGSSPQCTPWGARRFQQVFEISAPIYKQLVGDNQSEYERKFMSNFEIDSHGHWHDVSHLRIRPPQRHHEVNLTGTFAISSLKTITQNSPTASTMNPTHPPKNHPRHMTTEYVKRKSTPPTTTLTKIQILLTNRTRSNIPITAFRGPLAPIRHRPSSGSALQYTTSPWLHL
jgi:hypothetical protein